MIPHRKSHKLARRLTFTAAALAALNTQAFASGLKSYEIASPDTAVVFLSAHANWQF